MIKHISEEWVCFQILEWFGWEGSYRGLVHPPCHGQGFCCRMLVLNLFDVTVDVNLLRKGFAVLTAS